MRPKKRRRAWPADGSGLEMAEENIEDYKLAPLAQRRHNILGPNRPPWDQGCGHEGKYIKK